MGFSVTWKSNSFVSKDLIPQHIAECMVFEVYCEDTRILDLTVFDVLHLIIDPLWQIEELTNFRRIHI